MTRATLRRGNILVFVKKYDSISKFYDILPRVILDAASMQIPLYHIYVCERVGTFCDSTFHIWLARKGDKLSIIHGELRFYGVYSPLRESNIRRLAEHGFEEVIHICTELHCNGIELGSRYAFLVEILEPLLNKLNSNLDQKFVNQRS
jgi:hypothetical protein